MAGVDRISELPEPILQHILSFLSSKQAIQTSALSRTWHHVGPTRPKIELRQSYFKKSGRESFLSVLDKTLQRYNHQNLPVHELILEMSSSESDDQLAVGRVLEKTLFNGLKRLSLTRVQIKAKTLEKIIISCPLLEYLLASDCVGLKTIPATIFQAEFLTELHLTGHDVYAYGKPQGLILTVPTDQLLLIKRLKTLSLERVDIAEETLDKIMCDCPLIERLLLHGCVGLTNIQLIKNNHNLKHFSGSFYGVNTQSFEIHSPTIETIRIVDCPDWYGQDKYFFPRLKSLYLNRVRLPAELFKSFSSNFPSLEDLELEYCYSLEEIQLTACLIKRLILITGSENPIKATIYAPNLRYFKFFGHYPPQLIFYSETAGREWKSHLEVWSSRKQSDNKDLKLSWFIQLRKLLNSLRESQISLVVDFNPFKNLKVEDTNDAIFYNPIPLEHISVEGGYENCPFPDLLNCLFLICRPRYISMHLFTITTANNLEKEKDKLVEFITFKTIQNKGEMNRGYLWIRDLEEISMQVSDERSQGWHTVGVEGTSLPQFTMSYCNPEIRFSMKWRE